MSISVTPVLYPFATVIIEICLQRFPVLLSQIDLGKSNLRAELSGLNSIPLKPVKGTQLQFALYWTLLSLA